MFLFRDLGDDETGKDCISKIFFRISVTFSQKLT